MGGGRLSYRSPAVRWMEFVGLAVEATARGHGFWARICQPPATFPGMPLGSYESYPDANTEAWRQMLTGEHPQMRKGRAFWKWVPAKERCKMCSAPYDGIGGIVSKIRGRGPGNWNPRICYACETFSRNHPGGVELTITVAFVDVRNSTELSERLSPTDYARAMNRFYAIATNGLTDSDAIIDKLVGDEVMALFLPAFAGENHAASAIAGCQEIMKRIGYGSDDGPFIEVGAGVNTGLAYVGVVGDRGNYKDFTALGEEINLASRLVQAAASGETLVTESTRSAARLPVSEQRALVAKGFKDPITVTVLRV